MYGNSPPNPNIDSKKRQRTGSSSASEDSGEPAPWPRFLVIKNENDTTKLSTLNSCAISLNITGAIGSNHKITRLRSGDLLIEVATEKQASALLLFDEFRYSGKTYKVKVEPHRSLNSCKGVARSYEFKIFQTEDEIVECLAPQGVVSCKRLILKRQDKENVTTGTVFLTFNSSRLPDRLKLGFVSVKVDEYVPAPLRCFRCQRFGHMTSTCKGRSTCAKCAGDHEDKDCTTQTKKCVNCSGPHPVFSRDCPVWIREKEVQTVKTLKKVTYREAKAEVEARYPRGESFSAVLQKNSLPQRISKSVGTQTTSFGTQTEPGTLPPLTLLPPQEKDTVVQIIRMENIDSIVPVLAGEAMSGASALTASSDGVKPELPPPDTPGVPAPAPTAGAAAATPLSGDAKLALPSSDNSDGSERPLIPSDPSSVAGDPPHPHKPLQKPPPPTSKKPSLHRTPYSKGADNPLTLHKRERGTDSEECMEDEPYQEVKHKKKSRVKRNNNIKNKIKHFEGEGVPSSPIKAPK